MQRSRRAAEQALELDPELAEAHVALGLVLAGFDWDWVAAERSLERGVGLNPNYVFGLQAYAGRLTYLGRLDEALELALLAEELDPLGINPAREATLGWIYWLRGEQENAVRALRAKIELQPSDPVTHDHLGVAHCEADLFGPGLVALERARELSPADTIITGDLAHCYARAGRIEAARELVGELERRALVSYVSPMAIALVYVGLGDTEAAFAWLERSYELHALSLPSIAIDSRWYALADDPRYADLLRRIDLPLQAERIAKSRS